MARFGDRMALGVTLNEPNLARLLSWIELPDIVRELERATLKPARPRASIAAPCERDASRGDGCDGRRHDRRAPRSQGGNQGSARRSAGGAESGIVDDVADGDDPSVRDRKRARCTSVLSLRDDDFVGVQNYERIHYAPARCHFRQTYRPTRWGPPSSRSRSAGAVRYAYESAEFPSS